MGDLIVLYITASSKEEAEKVAKRLLEKKLIACANIFSGIDSFYLWEGKIQNSKECVLIAKTLGKNFEKVKEEVCKIHSYKVPCIVKIPACSYDEYFGWLEKELKKPLI